MRVQPTLFGHSPGRLVSTVMGASFLAAIIAQFTGVDGPADADPAVPPPIDTVHVYGDVFANIAVLAGVAAAVCLLLSPLLTRWMHADAPTTPALEQEG